MRTRLPLRTPAAWRQTGALRWVRGTPNMYLDPSPEEGYTWRCEFAPFCSWLIHPTACLTSQPRQEGAAHSAPVMWGR